MPARVDLPKEMIFGRHEIRLYTFDDLEATGRVALKQRALNLRDMLSDNPHVPRLSPSSSPEQLVLWLLEVQCLLIRTTGAQLSPQDFGAPASSQLMVSSGQLGIAGGAQYPEYGGAGLGGGYGGQQRTPEGGRGGQQVGQQGYGAQQGYPPMAPQSSIGYDPYGQLPMGSPMARGQVDDPNRITPRAAPPAHASQYSAPPGTPGALRPDQQADSEAAAIRRRAQASSQMW